MDSVLAARSIMGISLGFHIVFAVVGMVMPILMSLAHYRWLKTKDKDYYTLTRWWMKGLGIFFATGAVSGTALSFELGLLWPGFMVHAGPIFGMPFSWEGTAFFLEAIFLGLYLYGFNHLKPWVHWWTGVGVGFCGMLSGVFVVAANAWMNSPAGFDWINGEAYNIDPVKAMFNDAWFSQAQHTVVTATLAVSCAVLGIHCALLLYRGQKVLNLKAIKVVLPVFILSSLLTPLSGDISAKDVARRQPLKLAAMEAHFDTHKGAGLWIGGIPDKENKNVKWGVQIPYLLSLLATNDPNAEIIGLNDFPEDEWPPLIPVHLAFQLMVGIGTFLFLLSIYTLWRIWKKKDVFENRTLLKIFAFATPLGIIAIEAGWIVTEVGRQPWIIYGILKTKDSVSPMPGLEYFLIFFTTLYIMLALTVAWLMYRQFQLFMKKDNHV